MEAAAAAPARLRRGRAPGAARAVRDLGARRARPASTSPRRARTPPRPARGCPTEDEWQLAAEAGLLDLSGPRVWNWTESEHSDGRTRFAILKGGSDWEAEGSDWYVDGGPQEPAYSLKLLLLGGGMARSPRIGFRLAVDLP